MNAQRIIKRQSHAYSSGAGLGPFPSLSLPFAHLRDAHRAAHGSYYIMVDITISRHPFKATIDNLACDATHRIDKRVAYVGA